MADLALESDVARPAAAAKPASTGGGAGRGIAVLDGQYTVQADQPLPALSTSSAQAFVATDNGDPALALYALVVDPRIPFRPNAVTIGRDLDDQLVVKPVQSGSIDWPQTGRSETMLLLRRPPGDPLMATTDAEIQPWKVPELAKYVMKPAATLLAALAEKKLSHRNIRPTNLFRSGSELPVMFGEFYSAPPGLNQPAVFEPLERAMCHPSGRGTGDIPDDLFALGVTALFLVLGRNPVAHLDDKTLLARRAEMGTYAALTMDERPPSDLATVIRSLLHDDPIDRCTVDDLMQWATLGVAAQVKPVFTARSDRGFEFAGGSHHTGRELALAFSENWQAAREVVLTDTVERWAERSIKDAELTQKIAACRLSGTGGPRMVSDDLLLARTIVTLDPDGPLHFQNLTVMPDGLGTLAAAASTDPAAAATLTEMVSSQLMQFWFETQYKPGQPALVSKGDAEKIRAYVGSPGPGFAIERCAYEMNKGLACQSPRLANANVLQVRELLEVLDAGAGKGEQQLDRHVAAFLGARYSGSIDPALTEFGSAKTGEAAMLAQLKIFAAAQLKHGPPELPKLAESFFNHFDTLISSYHNVELRKRLRRAAERIVPTGKLPELLGIVSNKNYMRLDEKGFEQAKRQHVALGRHINAEEDSLNRTGKRSLVMGRQAAAFLSTTIGAAIVVMVTLGALG